MAPAIPLLGQIVAGIAVSKIVGKLTGSEIVGAIAGGFVGMGVGFSPTSGYSWTGFGGAAGAPSSGVGSVGGVSPGGGSILSSTLASTPANIGSGLTGFGTGTGVGSTGAMGGTSGIGIGGTKVGGALASAAQSSPAWGTVATAAPTVAAAPGASGGGGLLSKAGQFLNNNATLANLAFRGLEGAMTPDALDEIEARKEALMELDESRKKDPVNAGKLVGMLDKVNTNLGNKGYKPQVAYQSGGSYSPTYTNLTSPNYTKIVNSIKNRRKEKTA